MPRSLGVKLNLDGIIFIPTFTKINTMSNKQFEWTDELVVKAIKERLMWLQVQQNNSTTADFVKNFKSYNKPKPLFIAEDGAEVYKGDTVWIIRDIQLTIWKSLADDEVNTIGLKFSSYESAENYVSLKKKRFSLSDVQYLLTRSSYGNQFIDSVTEALTKYDKK